MRIINIQKKQPKLNLANILFVLLIPGFFFYSYAVASSYIAALPGGWFGILSILSILCLAPTAILAFINSKGSVLSLLILFMVFLLFIASWAVFHYLMGSQFQQNIVALEKSGRMVVLYFALFYLGSYIFPEKWFTLILYLSFFGMILLTLINIDPSRMMFYAKVQFEVSEGVAKYQGFARSFAATAIILIGITCRIYWQAALTMISLLVLYFLGARSEFYGFVIVAFVSWLVAMRSSTLLIRLFFSAIFVCCLILFFSIQISEFSNRQFEIFKVFQSTSVARRLQYLSQGWHYISNSVVLGDYAGQLRNGEFGSYIHNLLAAWRQFGILGFGLYFSLSILSLLIPVNRVVFRESNDPNWRIALYMNCYTFILSVAAKSVFGGLAPLSWGLTLNALRKEQTSYSTFLSRTPSGAKKDNRIGQLLRKSFAHKFV